MPAHDGEGGRPRWVGDRVLLTAPEVAAWLGVGVRMVYRLVQRGRLHAPLRIRPRTVRWRVEDVEAYLESKAQAEGRAPCGE